MSGDPSPQTIESLLEEACRQTGLNDFGDRHFTKGLTVLVEALPREAALNAVGTQMVYGGSSGCWPTACGSSGTLTPSYYAYFSKCEPGPTYRSRDAIANR